jgi:hypothetical protein
MIPPITGGYEGKLPRISLWAFDMKHPAIPLMHPGTNMLK